MGRIQTSIGLISGMDIAGTVEKLIALESVPLTNLQARVTKYQEQQSAFSDLSALFMKASYMISNLGKVTVHERLDVKSSNESALKVTRKGNPPSGTHTFTPVKMATSHQILSSGKTSATSALGKEAEVSIRFGRNLETNFNLKDINGGDGFSRGQIRITDQSGNKATIDLRGATTMKDVLDAINNSSDISVLAELDGDRLKLTDISGGSSTNLIVQEVGGGSTAASLGLAGINTDQTVASGETIVRLGNNLSLNALNDGNGIAMDSLFTDLDVTFSDGSTTKIDFAQIQVNSNGTTDGTRNKETTLGELLNTINTTAPAKLKVEISDDGTHLVWHDLTYVSGTSASNGFKVSSSASNRNPILHSLGIGDYSETGGTGVEGTDGTIEGRRIIGNLNSVLLSSLNGGRGVTLQAGDINLTDADGNTGTITFTADEVKGIDTLDEYIDLMNTKLDASGVKFQVKLNGSKSGLELVDFSNGAATSIQFEDVNGGNLASAMGLERLSGNLTASYSSQSLNLQVVSMNTKLADLNGGKGVDLQGAVNFTDSSGRKTTVTLSSAMETVDDFASAMSAVGIVLKVNETGDGFMLVDISNGSGSMSVSEGSSYSTAAKDLNLLGHTAETKTAYAGSNVTYRTMDCSMNYKISLEETDSLTSLKDAINNLGAGFTATIVNDGSSYRLSVGSDQTGFASNIVLDLSELDMDQDDLTSPQDAVLIYGSLSGSGIMITSKTNTIVEPVPGITLTINSTTASPVTISTERSSVDVKASIKTFVENYNAFREKYNEYNYSNVYSGTFGVLFGDSLMLRLDSAINDMLTSRVTTTGKIQSLRDLGLTVSSESGEVISIDDEEQKEVTKEIGKLTFDEEKFDSLFEQDPEAIKNFFIQTQTVYDTKTGEEKTVDYGFAAKYTAMAETFTDSVTGSLGVRYASLQSKIDDGNDRAVYLQKLLDSKKTRLTNSFVRMEQALAKIQDSANAVSQIGASTGSTSA
ncbi:MAG: flagellar filament capping protein FliD [Planctomycetaceae bacterium]|jgi:flagellar hook-associated protein 2|nr:flagellar filament capping protein FliD [Planctomycetaceae bacterium]